MCCLYRLRLNNVKRLADSIKAQSRALRKIFNSHPSVYLKVPPQRRRQVPLRIFIAGKVFDDTFMVTPTMGTILTVVSFPRKIRSDSWHLSSSRICQQLKHAKGKFKCDKSWLCAAEKLILLPFLTFQVWTNAELGTSQWPVEATRSPSRNKSLLVTTSLIERDHNRTDIPVTNPQDHTYTAKQCAVSANFIVLLPNQAKHEPKPPEQLTSWVSYRMIHVRSYTDCCMNSPIQTTTDGKQHQILAIKQTQRAVTQAIR